MGNISFVSSKKNLDFRGVTALLERINAEFFDSLWTIDHDPKWDIWQFGYNQAIPRIGRPDEEMAYDHHYWEFHLSESKRKLSSKGPRPGVGWTYWAWNLIQNECAREWSGRRSDESQEGTWAPYPYRNFEKWLESFYAHWDDQPERKKEMMDRERSYLPEAFAAVAKKKHD